MGGSLTTALFRKPFRKLMFVFGCNSAWCMSLGLLIRESLRPTTFTCAETDGIVYGGACSGAVGCITYGFLAGREADLIKMAKRCSVWALLFLTFFGVIVFWPAVTSWLWILLVILMGMATFFA